MSNKNPAVDAYFSKAAPFARPILVKLRALFHSAGPQLVETIKWGIPHFERHGIVGSVAAFQKHVSLGFWKAFELNDPQQVLIKSRRTTLCACQFQTRADLPADRVLLALIRQAIKLNIAAANSPKKKSAVPKPKRPAPRMPADLAAALRGNPRAAETYSAFSPSHKREYIEWISEAKRPETRARRVAQTVGQLSAGKAMNWKYERKGK